MEPKNPEPREVIARLKSLRAHFNASAEDYRRMESTLGDALALLEDAEAKKSEARLDKGRVALDQRAGLLAGLQIGTQGKARFVVVADGSGSMHGSPITAALDTAELVQKAGTYAKAPSGGLLLWGDPSPVAITGDLGDASVRRPVLQGLNLGTDLAPTAAEMRKIAAFNTVEKKATHFLVFSDGDIFDREKAGEQLAGMLQANKTATVDFFILARVGTRMEGMVKEFELAFPGRVNQHMITVADASVAAQDKVLEVAEKRLRAGQPKAKPALQP